MTRKQRSCGVLAGFVAVLGSAVTVPAVAEPPGLAQLVLSQPAQLRPRNCQDADMVTLKFCAADDFRTADKALNKAYQAAREVSIDDAGRALLLDAQRSWLRYRDALCKWEEDGYRGGTMGGLVVLNCLARVTMQQTKTLEDAVKP